MRNYILKTLLTIVILGVAAPCWAAVFHVDDFGDAGDANLEDGVCRTEDRKCTLRAAAQQAKRNSWTRIVLPDGTYELSSGKQIDLSSNLRIEGGGADRVVISGMKKTRVFHVSGAAYVTLSGIGIRDGRASMGGGIMVSRSSKLAIADSVISGNYSGNDGGALYISLGAVSIDNSTIENNEAQDRGGAIYIRGSEAWLRISGSELKSNRSISGGGIYCGEAKGVVVEGTMFEGNGSVGTGPPDGGGAIYNDGCSFAIEGGEFTGNSAEGRGGALLNAAPGAFAISGTIFSDNDATGDGGAIYSGGALDMRRVFLLANRGSSGGALYDAGESSLSLLTVAGNSGNGALYRNSSSEAALRYSTVARNDGGNIVNEAGILRVNGSLIAGARGGSDCSGEITSTGYNLDSDGSCALGGEGDISSADPLLVAAPGGKGYEPGGGSPALDAGSPDCPPLDQRFHKRLGRCDIGALERGGAAVQAGTISFGESRYMVREEDGAIEITLTRAAGNEGDVSVRVQEAGMGTARAGADFRRFDGLLRWSDGESGDKKLRIEVIQDGVTGERIESLAMFLGAPSGGAGLGANRRAVLDIVDAGARFGELAFENASYAVSENQGSLSVVVKRSNGDVGRVSVKYATGDKEAAAGKDYGAVSGTLVFADQEVEKSITIPIMDNSIKDGDRTFTIELSDITGGAEAGRFSSATVTINDDESGGTARGGSGDAGSGAASGGTTGSASSGGGGSLGLFLLLAPLGLGVALHVASGLRRKAGAATGW